jgi:hypothetical protein
VESDEELSLPNQESRLQPSPPELPLELSAGSVTTSAISLALAVLHPVHQQVANQRRPADRHHECRHSARHRVLRSRAREEPLVPTHRNLPGFSHFVARGGTAVH